MNKLQKILQSLLVLILFTPLVLDLHFYQPYISAKYFYFILLLILALPFVFALLKNKKIIWQSNLVRVVFGFLAFLLSSLFLSIDPLKSFFGDWQRFDGLLYFLFFFIFFLVLILVFEQKKDWLHFLRVNQLVVLATLLWAYGQYFALGFFADDQAGRVFALIGNANFLAHYLLLALFLSLFLVYFDQKFKIYHLLLSLLIFPVILMTQSRAAFLSLVLVFLILAIVAIIKFWQKSKKTSLGLIVLLFLLALFSNQILSHRFTKYSWQDTTIETRLVAWQAGLIGWQDKPLFGWGRNNFNLVFNKYFDLKIYKGAGTRMWFDKAHNQYLDYLVEQGILGLVFYLIFLLIPFSYFQKIKKKHGLAASIFLFSGLVANIIFLFFNFDTLNSYLLYFVYLALIYYLSFEKSVEQKELKQDKYLFVFGLVLLFFSFCYILFPQIQGNLALKKIFLSQQNNLSLKDWSEQAEIVAQKTPEYQEDLSFVLAESLEKSSWEINDQIQALQTLNYYGNQAAQQHILDARLHYLIANTFLRWGAISSDLDKLEKAKSYYQEILPRLTNQKRPELVYNLASANYNLSLFLTEESEKNQLKKESLSALEDNFKRFPKIKEAKDKLEYFQYLFEQ
ncbi:O-antigen ligase family protein [Candidatus Nomurabacteria bacterium]|nr:O-antigen ligase family protein [Candidatus Nomurabacteria bacterium]